MALDNQKNSKTENLLKNTGILAIGSFSSKVLVFLLVPLYTAVLTTEEYGAYDIILSTCTLLTPILTLNIADAMLRFPLEEGANVPRVARLGIGVTFASGLVVLAGQLAPGAPWESFAGIGFVAPLYFSNSLYQLLVVLARGVEQFKDVAVAGVLSSAIIVGLNVGLLLLLGWGLDGFFIANIAGMLVPAAYLLLRMRPTLLGPSASSSRDHGLLARMVRYSMPLGLTVLGWWMITTSGRYIVLAFCGLEANGLYSVAGKVPAILTTVASVFMQAWQVSVIKDFDRLDRDGFLLGVFDRIEMLLVLLCAILIPATPLVAAVLFQGEFYEAWRFVPFLLIYVVFNTMGGLWGPFFSARYDTGPMATSTALGGVVNIALGVALVIPLGVQGVALASLFAGLTNWAWRGAKVRRHVDIDFHMGRSLAVYGVLCAQGAVMVAGLPTGACMVVESLLLITLFVYYRNALQRCLGAALARLGKGGLAF